MILMHTIVGVYCRTYLLTFYDSANVEQMGTLTSQGFRFVPEVSQFSYSVSGGTVYLGDFEYPLGVKDYKTVTLWLDIVYLEYALIFYYGALCLLTRG